MVGHICAAGEFIRSVRSQAASRIEAGTLACPAKLVESVLTEYLAGTWGGYKLDPEAVDEVLRLAEHEAAGLDPSRAIGIDFSPLFMLLRAPTAELLAARAQALVADVVTEARREIMEKSLEPVVLPVATAAEAERWITDEGRAASWTEDERQELDALREEFRSVVARIERIDAGANELDVAGRRGIMLPLPLGGDELPPTGDTFKALLVGAVFSPRGGLPALEEHTRLIVNATGAPAPSVTLHILTGERLQYASVTMGNTRFATTLPGGHTVIRREVRFVFRSPDIDQTNMLSLHRMLRKEFSAGYTKSLDARDVELALLVWECLEEFEVPPSASFPFKSFGLTTTKLFETVRERLIERGQKALSWKGLYQRFQRITDRLDRTITVIPAEEEDFTP